MAYADPTLKLPDTERQISDLEEAGQGVAAFVIDIISVIVVSGGLIYVAIQGVKWQWGDKDEATENLKQFVVGTGLYLFSGTIVVQIFKFLMA
jgi:hypothetical protein